MAVALAKRYACVTQGILAELRRIVGTRSVLVDKERMEAYSHDETDADEYGHMPEVVVLPTATEQVSEIVKLANRELIPVTPRGPDPGFPVGQYPSLEASFSLLKR